MSRPRANAEDRATLGPAAAYPAAPPADDLRQSPEKRRLFGWQVARRTLEEVGLAAEGLNLPRWRSWYDRVDLNRLFERGMLTIGKPARRAREPFSAAQLDELETWNATQRPIGTTTPATASGLGGLTRTLYGREAARHILANYGELAACRKQILAAPIPAAQSGPEDNHAPCFAREFPPDSALVKTVWRRTAATLPAFDTSPAALAKLRAEAEPTWEPASLAPSPADGEIFRARTVHSSFDLVGLHIMTKEMRHWVWVTLWWSPAPNSDLGADRPADWSGLAPAWRNYKMCVAVDFNEPDGGETWCSNPYIEAGHGLAATNCIGCHQHSGSGLTGAEAPAGPAQTRQNFPYDYVWSLGTEPDFVAARMQDSLDYYDAIDP